MNALIVRRLPGRCMPAPIDPPDSFLPFCPGPTCECAAAALFALQPPPHTHTRIYNDNGSAIIFRQVTVKMDVGQNAVSHWANSISFKTVKR